MVPEDVLDAVILSSAKNASCSSVHDSLQWIELVTMTASYKAVAVVSLRVIKLLFRWVI